MSVTTALTASLLVTFFVYVVPFTDVHPLGAAISSLHVNVNNKFPLVHAASVIVHVGLLVSIFFHVTVTSFVVSPSVSVITHVSSPTLFALGVYVILFPFTLQLHFHCVDSVFTVAVIVSQLHAAAALNVFQFAVFALFPTFVSPTKLFAVNTTSVHVYVTVSVVTFHAASFTFTVTL